MKKKYIDLIILGSSLSVATIVGANLAVFINKNNTESTNNINTYKIINNHKYYNANGFLLSTPRNSITIDNITYSLNEKQNTASVINVKNNIGTLTIPSCIEYNNNYYNVTSISDGACYNKQITKLILSNNIVSIGADAFANNLLTNITLPTYLASLGNNAFSNNPFAAGTVINLPSNCSWNKNATLAPFNNNNNMGNFARCVKYVIQNLAVYGYVYNANSWEIVSWMPQVENAYPNAVKEDDKIFTNVAKYNQITQHPTSASYGAETPFLNNKGLQNTAIVCTNDGVNQAYGFETNNNNLTFYWTNRYFESNSSFILTLYNPDTCQEIYNNQNNYGSKNSIPINYGDIIGIRYGGGNWYLYDGLPASQLNNSTIRSCANSANFAFTYATKHNEVNYYQITKSGLIPYQNILHVNLNCLQQSKLTFNLTGTTLANHEIIATINNQTYYGISNNQGYFSIPIISNSPLTLGTEVLVNCSGCMQFKGKLVGDNPINSGILFEGSAPFGILPDGYSGTYKLWNNSQSSMPIFNNPITNNNDSGYDPNPVIISSQKKPIDFSLTDSYVNNQGKKITTSVSFYQQKGAKTSYTSTINTELQQLKFNPEYVNTLTLTVINNSQIDICKAVYNGNCISCNRNSVSNAEVYTFEVTNNSFYSKNPNFYGNGMCLNGHVGGPTSWVARNFCLVSNYLGWTDGTMEDDSNIANAFTPNAAMWLKVKQITAHCESTYEKAIAINEWVTHNMSYTSYSYHHTIAQTFNHLEGVCGNYAALSAFMCSMAGIVSRVVVGQSTGPADYFTWTYIDHAWMQFWDEQLGSWITMDPTWGWWGYTYGSLQARLNISRRNEHVCLVLWPAGTNYFSYFTGHSYAALLNLDNYFGYMGGATDTYYPMKNAAYISQLLHQTTSITGEEAKVINF